MENFACPLPFRDLFPSIRSAIKAAWQERCDTVMARTKMGEITTRAVRPWPTAPVRERRHETALTRLQTGHAHLTHGYLIYRGVPPYCDDYLAPLTVRHLLFNIL